MLKNALAIAGLVGIVFVGSSAPAIGSLSGSWQCGNESLLFKSDTVLVYDGEQMRYQRRGNVLQVQEEYGLVDYPFVLAGHRLDVTFPDGSVIRCTRVKAGPDKSPAGGTRSSGAPSQLRGMLCRWSGSSGMSSRYSSSTRVSFDGAGRFSYSSESAFSGDAGMGYGSGPGAGGTYRVTGDVIHFTFRDGSTGTAKVNMRQNDGRITELMFNGQLYATGLCQ